MDRNPGSGLERDPSGDLTPEECRSVDLTPVRQSSRPSAIPTAGLDVCDSPLSNRPTSPPCTRTDAAPMTTSSGVAYFMVVTSFRCGMPSRGALLVETERDAGGRPGHERRHVVQTALDVAENEDGRRSEHDELRRG